MPTVFSGKKGDKYVNDRLASPEGESTLRCEIPENVWFPATMVKTCDCSA